MATLAPEATPELSAATDDSTDLLSSTDETQGRDAAGRFTQAPGAPDESPATDEDAGSEEDSDQSAAESDAKASDATPVEEPASEPFVYRADRAEHTLDGAELFPDGSLYIPPDKVAEVRQLLAEGVTHRGSFRQEMARVKEEASSSVQAEQRRANAYGQAAVHLLEFLKNPQNVIELATDYDKQFQYLTRELQVMLREAGVTGPRPAQTPNAPAQSPTESGSTDLEARAWATLEDDVLTSLAHEPKYAALARTQEERQALLGFFQQTAGAYFVNQGGQIFLNQQTVRAVLDREVARLAAAGTQAQALTKAAKENAKRGNGSKAPPTVTTRGSAAPGEEVFAPKTRDEWERAIGLR